MTAHLTLASLEAAEFWDETICVLCGTIQTESNKPGEPCQECDSPDTLEAAKLVAFLNLLEESE